MKKSRIIIAGTRTFNDYEQLYVRVTMLISRIPRNEIEIVSGGAKGADQLGEQYAKHKGYALKIFPADWKQLGKSAGYIRNKEMAEYATHLIVFWDGKSKGTKHMIDLAEKCNLKIRICKYQYLS